MPRTWPELRFLAKTRSFTNSTSATRYEDCFVKSINWIYEANRSEFVCANEQYYMLREDSPVTWRAAKCDEFLAAANELWNQW